MAGAAAERPLRHARQARGLSRPRGLQDPGAGRQVPLSHARRAGRRSGLRARRLVPGGGGAGQCAGREIGQDSAAGSGCRPAGGRSDRRAPKSTSWISWPKAPTTQVKAWLGGPADVVMSDMAASASGHKRTDHLRIVALCRGGGRICLRRAGSRAAPSSPRFWRAAPSRSADAAEEAFPQGRERQTARQPGRSVREIRCGAGVSGPSRTGRRGRRSAGLKRVTIPSSCGSFPARGPSRP